MKGFVLALLAFLAGCADPPRGIDLVIESDIAVPDELNYVEITAIASKSESSDEVCSPVSRGYSLTKTADLPVRFAVDAGSEYAAWAAFRVEGGHKENVTGDFNPLVSYEVMSVWPSSGRVDVQVHLRADCYGKSPCLYGGQCGEGGLCVDSPVPRIFDDQSLWDDVSCDHDGPEPDAGSDAAD
jgi:hypothetical protein